MLRASAFSLYLLLLVLASDDDILRMLLHLPLRRADLALYFWFSLSYFPKNTRMSMYDCRCCILRSILLVVLKTRDYTFGVYRIQSVSTQHLAD